MSTPIEPQGEPTKKNTLAIASLVLGALSVAFAQFCTVPGNISSVGCLGGILAIAAIVTGVMGIRSAQQGQGKRSAIGGIFTAAIGLLVFLAVFVPSMMTPGGLWTHVGATPTPTITPTPTMTPTPTIPPTETPVPTSTPAPQTHYGEKFAITCTDEWEVYKRHSEPGSEYLIIENPYGILLHVYRYTLPERPDLESEAAAFLSNSFESISMIEEGEMEVGGQKGLMRRFVHQSPRGQSHVLLVAVANEYDFYVFLVFASTQELFTRHQAETEEIILSTQFTTAGAPAPTAAPEPTSPTSVLPTNPQVYKDDKFALTYPGDWLMVDTSSDEYCNQPHVTCLFLVHAEDDIKLVVERKTLDDAPDLEEIDQEMWNRYISVSLLSKSEIEVDGRPGIQRTFSQENPESPTGQIYALQVVVVNGYDSYWMLAESSEPDTFSNYQSTIGEIIASIEFMD